MFNALKKLFAKEPQWTPEEQARDKDPAAVAAIMDEQEGFSGQAQASDVEAARANHQQFLDTVLVRPGVRLVDSLKGLGAGQVVDWFRPETAEPEPKALAQLFLDIAKRGQTLAEQPGFDVFIHGRWSAGGGPSDASYEALQWIVKATGRPIKVFFQESPRDEEFRVTTIEVE
jgi:hypothetical protein